MSTFSRQGLRFPRNKANTGAAEITAPGWIMDDALEGWETENHEMPILTRKGEIITILLNSSSRRDAAGNIVGCICIGQDITERKRAEENTRRLAAAIEGLSENFALYGADDRLIVCNEGYRRLNKRIAKATTPGTSFEEHLRAMVERELVPEAVGRGEAWIKERLARHRNPKGPFELLRQDSIWLLVHDQRMADGSTVTISTDITRRKQTEAQVIQASKLATLGEMATAVSHELNQPLNVIRMAAGNVLRKLDKGEAAPNYLRDKLKRIAGQTERAAAIIDHMRMFGRKAEENPTELDPPDAVWGALDLMGEQLHLAEIEVVTDLPQTCRPVLGHRVPMEQVILNLLANARDAIQGQASGGEKIIKISLEDRDGETVRIVVGDTGGGIAEENLTRIFDPFFTTKELGEGTGLGLSVSYGIIRDMGGAIEAENIEGGTRVTITLPVVADSAHSGSEELPGSPRHSVA